MLADVPGLVFLALTLCALALGAAGRRFYAACVALLAIGLGLGLALALVVASAGQVSAR